MDQSSTQSKDQEIVTKKLLNLFNLSKDEHKLTIDQVCLKYKTVIDQTNPLKSYGLSKDNLELNRKRFGENTLSPPKKPNLVLQYFKHLVNLFNLMLLVAGLLSFVLYAIDTSDTTNIYLGSVLIIVAFLNAFVEFFQEYKTAALLQSFLNLIPASANCIREGVVQPVATKDLVNGDLVSIKMGEKVPADLFLIQVDSLKIDNSSITGESEPQEKSTRTSNPETSFLQANNLVFNGNLVVFGEGLGIVIRTGDKTVIGQIAKMTTSEKKRDSQLSREIDFFVKKLAAFSIVVAVIFFSVGLIVGYKISTNFSFAVGIFVAFVPQGLPATVTILLTVAAKKLTQLKVLVKDLHGVETLGSITMLATDKTGTLTMNKMTVVGCWLNDQIYSTFHSSVEADELGDNEKSLNDQVENLNDLIMVSLLSSKAKFDQSNADKPLIARPVLGDATETGLLRFSALNFKSEKDFFEFSEKYPKKLDIPFNSNTKWSLTINWVQDKFVIFLKGAPERIVKMCSTVRKGNESLNWTEETTRKFDLAYEHFAKQGQRVLAFARLELDPNQFKQDFEFKKDPLNFPLKEFEFIGLISLMDPPKRGVRKALAACRTAGIQVVMVTGDHPLTAEAIARKIGLITGETIDDISKRLKKPKQLITEDEYNAIIIHGDQIDSFTDKDWDLALSRREIVFARTSPKHKLMIVTRCQAKGHIVGVSGDGVNDSPALKKADLGISMNKTGSDVSKEAAAMILLDDNFSSIVVGISQGRLIFANLKKSIKYTLTHIPAEVLPFILFIIIKMPPAISPILILLVDLCTELAPAVSFAWEVPESDLMLVPPRKVLTSAETAAIASASAISDNTITATATATSDVEGGRPKQRILFKAQRLLFKAQQMIFKMFTWIKSKFKRNETGEILVDNELLISAYLQSGLILTAGCFGAFLVTMALEHVPFTMLSGTAQDYFIENGTKDLTLTNGQIATPQDQVKILAKAQSSYFLAIVIGQWFTLFLVKHRYSYPVGFDLFKNKKSIIGIFIGAILASLIVYVKPFQKVFKTGPVSILSILCALAAGILMILVDFLVKYLKRKGYFGGMPKKNLNLLELVRTTSTC